MLSRKHENSLKLIIDHAITYERDMRVYRLHIRPGGGLGDPRFSFAYCLKENVLGVGWGLPARSRALTWEAYEKTGIKTYGSILVDRAHPLLVRGALLRLRSSRANPFQISNQ